MDRKVISYQDAINGICAILNQNFDSNIQPRKPAEYRCGGISLKFENALIFSVSVDVDPRFIERRLEWIMKVHCNANNLGIADSAEFAALYTACLARAVEVQNFLNAITTDLNTI